MPRFELVKRAPPLPEQRKIVAVPGLVQRAIEQQERLIALTTEPKKALLHKLFTQGLRGEPQKQTEIGPVPESWEVVEHINTIEQIDYGISPPIPKTPRPIALRRYAQRTVLWSHPLYYSDLIHAQVSVFNLKYQAAEGPSDL